MMTLWIDGEKKDVAGQDVWDEVSTLTNLRLIEKFGTACEENLVP